MNNQPDDGAYLPSPEEIARLAAELRQKHFARKRATSLAADKSASARKHRPRAVRFSAFRVPVGVELAAKPEARMTNDEDES